jgi:uncharacterized protein (TIGR00369 family)
MSKLNLQDDHKCFACGMENPDGLRLTWTVDGQTMTTLFTAEAKYQGWKGIVHGGILATLLDEAMARLSSIVCGDALTAEMTVRYVAPAHIGELLYVKGEIIKESRRLVEMKATIHRKDLSGEVVAHATGKALKAL